jgi:hypothetical protein
VCLVQKGRDVFELDPFFSLLGAMSLRYRMELGLALVLWVWNNGD